MSCGRKGRSSEKWNSGTEKVISMSKMPGVYKQGKQLWDKVYYVRSEKLIVILERNDILFLERLEMIRNLKNGQKTALMQFQALSNQSSGLGNLDLLKFLKKCFSEKVTLIHSGRRSVVRVAIALEVKCQRKMYLNTLKIKAEEWEICPR